MRIAFKNLGIQCVKKEGINASLTLRKQCQNNPFLSELMFFSLNIFMIFLLVAGIAHGNQPSLIDLKSVRLCFQAFLKDPQSGSYSNTLEPVLSDPIFDQKSTSTLVITKLSHCNAVCNGGQEMILLCEKVTTFLELKNFLQPKFTDRLQKETFKFVSTKISLVAGKIMASSIFHKFTSRLRFLLEHLATNRPTSKIQ